jgi:hypothetical protein
MMSMNPCRMKVALGDIRLLLLLGATAVFFLPFCYAHLLFFRRWKNTRRSLQLKAERV